MTIQAKPQSTPCNLRPCAARLGARWLAAMPLAAALICLPSVVAQAGPCLPINQKLLPLPEIRSNPQTHVLKGTILLTSEQRRLIFRAPGIDQMSLFFSMLIFVGILLFGLAYAWRKGVLSWRGPGR